MNDASDKKLSLTQTEGDDGFMVVRTTAAITARYARRDVWTVEEGIALLLGYKPTFPGWLFDLRRVPEAFDDHPDFQKIVRLDKLIHNSLAAGSLKSAGSSDDSLVQPQALIEWAEALDWKGFPDPEIASSISNHGTRSKSRVELEEELVKLRSELAKLEQDYEILRKETVTKGGPKRLDGRIVHGMARALYCAAVSKCGVEPLTLKGYEEMAAQIATSEPNAAPEAQALRRYLEHGKRLVSDLASKKRGSQVSPPNHKLPPL